jgi:DNA repair protein SbcC/Rad50
MISSVKLQNFQSHKETEIQFSKGVNVIVGQSDCGKTAILRALRWVFTNRPGGDEFRSFWGGETCVTVTLTDGTIITRSKDKSNNLYTLDDTEFTAFGTDVPQEIIKALNIDEINLQGQLDAPFLLSETSGNVAQHFNKVARLDKIDKGLSAVQKTINTIGTDIKYLEKENAELTEQYLELDYVQELESDVVKLEKMNERLLNKKAKLENLSTLITEIERCKSRQERYKDKVVGTEQIDEILALYEQRATESKKYKEMKSAIHRITTVQEEIKYIQSKVDDTADIDTVIELVRQRKEQEELYVTLQRLYTSILGVEESVLEAKENILSLEESYAADFPNVCPLCNTKMK